MKKPKDAGYYQAVENLAYYMVQTSDEQFGHFDTSEEMSYAAFTDPKVDEAFAPMDEVFRVILETYEVEYVQLLGETYLKMLEIDAINRQLNP